MIRHGKHPMVMLGLCLAACGDAPQATSLAPQPSTAIRVVSEATGEAPRRVLIDITLRNPTGQDLAMQVSSTVPAREGGIRVFEEHCFGGVCHGRFLGTGGFYGFWLAAHSTLTVRNLVMIWWKEGPVSLHDIHVRAAESLLLGDEDARDWFAGDPLFKGNAELDMDIHVANTARSTPGGVEVPAVLLNEVHVNFDSYAP
jgi:hypothetical protein